MATAEQIAQLRRYINEPDDVPPYTDAVLGALIDSYNGNVERAAASLWNEKASSYAELVDVQEGSSRRALSKLYEQAIAMGKHFGDVGGVVPTGRYSRTRQIERP